MILRKYSNARLMVIRAGYPEYGLLAWRAVFVAAAVILAVV